MPDKITDQEAQALAYRKRYRGVIGVSPKIPIKDSKILSLVYTPGVASSCLEIARDPVQSYLLSCRGNTVGILTDGSGLFRLGHAGPEAALPVMEGKSVIFKTFAGVDALPICIRTKDPYEFIETALALTPTFGAFCLEDIASPQSFTITDHLERAADIPVFNNHGLGVAIPVLAALINSMKVVDKDIINSRVVINGAGMAGLASADLLVKAGIKQVIVCDRDGALYKYRLKGMSWAKWEIVKITNPDNFTGTLEQALKNADVFIGLSSGNVLSGDMIKSMAKDPIVFALSTPHPEIMPEKARDAGAKVMVFNRADFPNQSDVAMIFPGFFRGILETRASNINTEMALSAAQALADCVSSDELAPEHVMPKIFDFRVAPKIAEAVAKAAIQTGEAKGDVDPAMISDMTRRYVYEGQWPIDPPDPKKKSIAEESLEFHRRYRGVLQIRSKIAIKDNYILGQFYMPPLAEVPARLIRENPELIYDYTAKGNLVAIVTDGSAVLGLGNIGPQAAMPVMEGKAILFQTFAGVEAFPICLCTQDADQIVEIVKRMSPTFGGINLEDISAPRCFYIERRLKEEMDIPVFHDDQHGTAIIVTAALLNSLKISGKKAEDVKVVINGAGAAAIAVCKLIMEIGIKHIILCDKKGAIYKGRLEGMNWMKDEMAEQTNPEKIKGDLAKAIKGADIFIGLSVAGALTKEMLATMAKDPIIFALANPTPEIFPDEAKEAGALIVATGRSDFANQVNNSLIFPGVFRGALDVRARIINEEMKIAAARTVAGLVSDKELNPEWIIPKGMDFKVPPAVAAAVARAAMESGVARIKVDPEKIAQRTRTLIYEGESGYHLVKD
ncbi:MAG: NADP-dependent malic enzyme [Desulfobacterium sp.]|nr:NADP-dependent malic enzyme [Desulfobacterium sp.]MBU4036476.1 NADP-dependent malic enzyme [Pseudomonadota bacterium]